MDELVLGTRLQSGTRVYFCEDGCKNGVYEEWGLSHILSFDKYDDCHIYNYIFNPDDGLWATYIARQLWEKHPHSHPHCTLFDMLYNKLNAKNYI